MSARIIIEKDGERWEVTSDYVVLIDDYGHVSISNLKHTLLMNVKELPPIIRTDNSEVIANLEAENAKLREALKPIMACKCNFDISWAFNDGTLLAYAVPMYDAVRKAQSIMKGEKHV